MLFKQIFHLACGSFTSIGENTSPRYTPYHIPHRTEVMGFMTFMHGDDRFYNNIFIQKYPTDPVDGDTREVGTHGFDAYPTYDEWFKIFDYDRKEGAEVFEVLMAHEKPLPIWSEGNIYLNGAKMCRQEIGGKVVDKISLDSIDESLADSIEAALSKEFMTHVKEMHCKMMYTDYLGKAFEPEQPYENPDGTPITFDTDYFGNHRGVHVIPGPFALS